MVPEQRQSQNQAPAFLSIESNRKTLSVQRRFEPTSGSTTPELGSDRELRVKQLDVEGSPNARRCRIRSAAKIVAAITAASRSQVSHQQRKR